MGGIRVSDALEISERDTVPTCQTCTADVGDGEEYCRSCADYWRDVDDGIFDNYWEVWD